MATTEQCPDCGALMTTADDDCPACSPEALAAAFGTQRDIDEREGHEVSDRTLRRRKTGDPYSALEVQLRGLTRRSKYLNLKLRGLESMVKDISDMTPEQTAAIAREQKQYADESPKVAASAAKCAAEMAKIMSLKSRMVDSLSREEQITQIVRWFRGLSAPKMLFLIDMLNSTYNEQKELRASRKAQRRGKAGLKAVT